MPYFEPITFNTGAYYCPNCKQWYAPDNTNYSMSCCLLHPPGDCCHMGEHVVEAPTKQIVHPFNIPTDN